MSSLHRTFSGMVAMALLVAAAAWPGRGRAEDPLEFSGERSFAHLETIAGLGPRPSGSAAMVKQRALLAAHFRAAGGTVRGQAFQVRDRRTGAPVHMENIIVEWHPDRRDRVLIGAHYDTRPFPDRDPVDPKGTFIGANDGASGVALLMELARAMPTLPGPALQQRTHQASQRPRRAASGPRWHPPPRLSPGPAPARQARRAS